MFRLARVASVAGFFALAALAAAGEGTASIDSARPLQLCIVEAMKNSAADDAFRREFATRLNAAMGSGAHASPEANVERVSGWTAAERLRTGMCDAVLVIGPTRPLALRRIDATTLAATLGPRRNYASVYFIIGNGDARLRRLLADEFPRALN